MQFASLLVALLFLRPVFDFAQETTPGLRAAMADLQRGDFSAAEPKLRAEAEAHPDDAWTLSLLAAALDNLKRIPEADPLHRRAIAKAPRSAEVLNNYAAHLWLAGKQQDAATVYREIVAIDPAHYNANQQLARLALQEHDGAAALRALDRLPAAQQQNPQVLLPRLQALYLAGDSAQADKIAAQLTEMSRSDPALSFALGITLSNAGRPERAESVFEATLAQDPANFNVLYDLGVEATRAGHPQRASEVLDAALRQQPQNVDVLYALACAHHALKQWETAVRLLSQAAKLDPARAEVQKMLAVATGDMGALDDAAAAWDRYLKLVPNDDVARRERGYTAAQRLHFEDAIDDLAWYVGKHPDDVAGHYELGQAERTTDAVRALHEFDSALAIDPNYVPARTARGSLYYQQGKPEAALADLEAAARLRPEDAGNFDRLGQAYQALDRTSDAVKALRRAAELAPSDSKILLHLAHSLGAAGDTEESKAVMDRFRQIGPEKKAGVRAGFVEYLSLSDEERHADYRARLEKALQIHPDDAALQVDYLKLLLRDGEIARVPAVVNTIAGMKAAPPLLADAGHALLVAQQYRLGSDVLQQAAAAGPVGTVAGQVALDQAVAAFRLGDAAKGLQLLSRAPESARGGDYYLSRAEMLEELGKSAEARTALDEALRFAPGSPDLYRRASAFLLAKGQTAETSRLLDRAAAALPRNREILLLRGIAAELAGNTDDAEHDIGEIQAHWPEWHPAWAAQGMILAKHGHPEEGKKAIETAVQLGASPSDVHFRPDGSPPDLVRLFFAVPVESLSGR